MNVKLNDNVLVVTGKYAGMQGKVISTSPKTGKIVVEGVNKQKKTKKARKANEVSQIIEQEGPIDVSNVLVVCPSCGAPVRVKYDITGEKKVRVCRKCGAVLDKGYTKKGAEKKEAPKKRTRKRDAKKAEEAQESESEE